jgi:hypothetical protein
MSVGIKGVVPGEATEAHIQRQMLLCKIWVGVPCALCMAAMLPVKLCNCGGGWLLAKDCNPGTCVTQGFLLCGMRAGRLGAGSAGSVCPAV